MWFHVVKENPQVKLILEKKGKDGARLWLPDKWKLAEGNRHIYLFGEDTVYICDEYYSRALRIFYRNLLQVAGGRPSGRSDLSAKALSGSLSSPSRLCLAKPMAGFERSAAPAFVVIIKIMFEKSMRLRVK